MVTKTSTEKSTGVNSETCSSSHLAESLTLGVALSSPPDHSKSAFASSSGLVTWRLECLLLTPSSSSLKPPEVLTYLHVLCDALSFQGI